MKKNFVVGFVAVGLIGLALWFSLSSITQAPDAPKTKSLAMSAPSDDKRSTATSPASTDKTSASVTLPPKQLGNVQTSLHKRFISATDLGAAYSEFSTLALNNPDAIYYQAMSGLACVNFTGKVMKTLEASAAEDPNALRAEKRAAALGKLRAACATMPPSGLEFGAGFQKAIEHAAGKGDPKSKAILLGDDLPLNASDYNAAAKSAEAVAYSRDPVVMDNLGKYFETRDGLAQWQIPGMEGIVSGKEMGAAFHLFACDMGDDCSGTSLAKLAACARVGRCDYLDRNSEYQNYKLTPDAYDRVQRIRDLISQGLDTRTWPPEFWSGVEKVPGTLSRIKPKS